MICVLFTEEVGGIFTVEFEKDGGIFLRTECAQDDFLYDEISSGLLVSKIRNTSLLMSVSEIYENLERYEDCNEILNMAYDCAPIGRMIVYRMVEVAVKLGNFDEAIELYKEFTKIAPHDLSRYVLKYQIYKGRLFDRLRFIKSGCYFLDLCVY